MKSSRTRLSEILHRINGFSLPMGGVQWTVQPQEREIVRGFLTFLEDRRVLFVPNNLEVPSEVETSVLKIREECTQALRQLDENTVAAGYIRAIRSACRRFLDGERHEFRNIYRQDYRSHNWNPGFFVALGELRSQIGLQVGMLSATFELEIEEDLASILPTYADDN